MTTPIDAPPAPAPDVRTGDVNCGAVVVGSNNNVTVICQAPGAQADRTSSSIGPARKQDTPINLLPDELEQDLIGRDSECGSLASASQASKRVSLWGDDGMGKTALVRKFSYSVRSSDGARDIAYIDTLGRYGEDLQLLVYDAFFDRPEGFIPNPTQMRNGLLSEQALIVLDNLGAPANEIAAVVGLAPKCTFVLISTSRVVKEGKSVGLGGLPEADAVRLFEEIFGHPLDEDGRQAAAQVCKLLEGRPGFIVNAAAHADDLHETPAQLLAELNALPGIDDQSLAAFAVSRLTPDEQTVLKFLAAAGQNPVTTAQLIFALPDIDVQAVLKHLKSLRLAQSHSPRYSLVGTLPAGLAAAFDLAPSRDALLQSSIEWLSRQRPSQPVQDSISMMLHVLKDAASRLKWSEVIRLGRLLEPFAFRYTRWQAWGDILEILLGAGKAAGDLALQGWALHQLGTRALAQGALKVASSNLEQALKIRQDLNDREGLEVTRHNLSVLKAMGSSAHGDGPGRGGPGGHALTYGFFGVGSIVVLALAAYLLSHRQGPPSPPANLPPVISTTAALPLTGDSTPTETPTSTPTETAAPTDTPTLTPPPTDTPTAVGPLDAVVTADTYLACHYGPGAVYLMNGNMTLRHGDHAYALGRYETALAEWLFIKPAYALNRPVEGCWASASLLQVAGDVSQLPEVDPHKVFVIYNDPKFVPVKYPPPTVVSTSSNGGLVQATIEGVDLIYIDPNHTDRESANSALFLVEFWICHNGKSVLDPEGIYFAYDSTQDTVQGTATSRVQDDGSCGIQPHGSAYLAHRDGYVGPVDFTVSP